MDLFLFRHERQTGPYTETDAKALVTTGEIERTCLAWQEGMAEWLPLEQVLDLASIPPAKALPAGLPPLPPRSRAEAVPLGVPTGIRTASEPAEPMKLGTKINVYGGQAFAAGGVIFVVLRWFAGCHHH